MAKLAVIGAGIGGLATALFLGRRGHWVTVFEPENRWPTGNLDEDFFNWPRPHAPHAVQPHALIAPVRNVLRCEAPDVYAALLRLGAREYHEFDWFGIHPPVRPGDEDLVTLRSRRIALETALYEAASREPTVELLVGEAAEGLQFDYGAQIPRVTGVRSGGELHDADLVLDIAGHDSPVGAWLTEAGCRAAAVENHHIGIACFTRWYRLRPGAPRGPGRVSDISVTPFAIGLVSPGDNDLFGITLAIPVTDPTCPALLDTVIFDSLAAAFPGPGAWLALGAKGIGEVQVMDGWDDRWTALVDENGPVVTGLLGVGDSLAHTNPVFGHGVAASLLAAQRVASTVDALQDQACFATDYHEWALRTLKPWFDHQVTVDRGDEAFLSGGAGIVAGHAFDAATLDDAVVMRAWAQVRHLVLTPERAFGSDEVSAHIARWLQEHPQFPSMPAGPSRDDWLAITAAPAQPVGLVQMPPIRSGFASRAVRGDGSAGR